jgi:hypothetical protein
MTNLILVFIGCKFEIFEQKKNIFSHNNLFSILKKFKKKATIYLNFYYLFNTIS